MTGTKANNIILNNQLLTATGNNLYLNGTLISGDGVLRSVYPTTVTYTGTHTLIPSDISGAGVIRMFCSTPSYIIVPDDVTWPSEEGTQLTIYQLGFAPVYFSGLAGVSIVSRGSATGIAGRYGGAILRKDISNTWLLGGDVS